VLDRNGWLTELRLPRAARVRWLATGLHHDGFSGPFLSYRVWPAGTTGAGRFTVRVTLPFGRQPKTVTVSATGGRRRVVSLRPGDGRRLTLDVPAARAPELFLAVRVTGGDADSTTRRGVRIDRIWYSRR
jgi:hypothetical protein